MSDNLGLVKFDFVSQIIIEYENVNKEDIFINFQKVVGGITEMNTPFAVESNVTEIPNFISGFILKGLYFKKMSGKPLMLLFEYPIEDDEVIIESSQNETTFNNIHYKYNFRIQPYHFSQTIKVKNNGTNVLLAYPENIIFDSNNSTVIRYIMTDPSLANDIKLDPNSESYLECNNINGMKKCEVPESHFTAMKSGYYNTYHKNHEDSYNIYYNAPLINITFSKADKITELHIEEKDNSEIKYIGFQGILNLVLDYNDNETNIFDPSDIEEKTSFETTIVVEDKNITSIFNIACKLWKPIDEKLNLICKLRDNLTYGISTFYLNKSSFYYNERKFVITQKKYLSLFQLNESLPFLYSSKQVLNIDEKTETCDLKFKIGEYHNEPLFMQEGESGLITLNECSVEEKELICKIKKDVIEEFAIHNGQNFEIYYFMLENKDIIFLNLNDYSIYDIFINYNLDKKDIYVEITKLLENNIDFGNYIAYETNVSNITNVDTKKFFMLKLSKGNNIECLLKKTEEMPLVMICLINKGGEFSLGEIENQTKVENTNIKYNFIIQPIINSENCTISGNGSIMLFAIQKVLNFTLYDSITIDLAIIPSFYSKGIRLNPEGNDLECKDIKEFYKRCTVPLIHFKNKTSGYYYTHHINNLNKYIIFYESSPFKIILPKIENISIKKEYNKEQIKILTNGVFFLVTDFNNQEKKIFNTNDNITFVGTLIDHYYEDSYEVNCKFWISNEDNLRIICI